jgi:hypothetical protein
MLSFIDCCCFSKRVRPAPEISWSRRTLLRTQHDWLSERPACIVVLNHFRFFPLCCLRGEAAGLHLRERKRQEKVAGRSSGSSGGPECRSGEVLESWRHDGAGRTGPTEEASCRLMPVCADPPTVRANSITQTDYREN